MADFEVRRDELRTTRTTDSEPERDVVGEGEIQLAVDRFGLTANNVTYGVFGDAMKYWEFFHASEEGWGRVPVWGYGDVLRSGVEGIEAGQRFYGFFPMASRITMRAEVGGPGFTAVDEHRRELPGVYNRYQRTSPEEPYLDEALLLRPLFGTSYLIEDFLRSQRYFDADAVVLSSASSKTAYGLAFLLAKANEGPHVLGLTSSRNVEFVESLNLYDRVITYDAISDALDSDDDLVFVDMAGDAAVRADVHKTAGERLKHSAIVGVTHWEEPAAEPGEPGPAPKLFFAPSHVQRLTEELGPGELQRRMASAWPQFAAQAESWMDLERHEGPEAVDRVWRALVDGESDPRRGHVLRLP